MMTNWFVWVDCLAAGVYCKIGAQSALLMLSVSGRSMVSPIKLLMYILWVPLLLIGILTFYSLPSVNGVLSGRNLGGNTRC